MLLTDGAVKSSKDTWGRSNDEIQRSLDVLDKVLSEFDDITNEKFQDVDNEKDDKKEESSSPVDRLGFQTSVEFPDAPPVDRTLKPNKSPPTRTKTPPPALPAKLRKIQSNPNILGSIEKIDKSNVISSSSENLSIRDNPENGADSLRKPSSETSSHEYQEINSDLVNAPRRSKSLPRQEQPKDISFPEEKKLRKSRSQIIEDGVKKQRYNEPRSPKEKHRRSEFYKDRYPRPKNAFPTYPYPAHLQNELRYQEMLKYASVDPYIMDHLNRIALDSRQYELMMNSQLAGVDPRHLLLQEELLHRYPHLVNTPIPYPPHMMMPDGYPIDYPDMLPNPLSYPMYPVLPPEMHHPYDMVYDDELDPRLIADPSFYPPELPPDFPVGYCPPPHAHLDKRLQDDLKLPQMDPTVIPQELENSFLLPEEEQLALSHWRNWSHITTDHRKTGFARHYNLNESGNIQPYAYPHHFRHQRQKRRMKKGGDEELNFGDETSFRVGDPVNCQKEKAQNNGSFSYGGKDSGFDEGIVIEDLSSDRKSPFPGTGGNMIVSGVFNDSSKMYIPAPPSPVPDYDRQHIDSDCESEILQKTLYDDDSKDRSRTRAKNGIDKMISDFHQRLPPPHESGSYSDDSLEEDSSISPSRPSTIGANTKRSVSIESLSSVDDSIASFHYVGAGVKKNLLKNKERSKERTIKPKLKQGITKTKSCDMNPKTSLNKTKPAPLEKNKSSGDITKTSAKPKFDTIRNLLKEGLLEGLDEKPPDFKPPPADKVSPSLSAERPDSGMGSRGSTAKSNDSVNSNLGSSNSLTNSSSSNKSIRDRTFSSPPPSKINSENYREEILRRKSSKSPAPKPPVNKSSNQGKPTSNNSWLYKQKRPAPQPNTNLNKDKVTHIDDVSNKNSSSVSLQRNSSTKENELPEDSIDRKLNYPVFSGPLSSPGLNKKPPPHKEKIKMAPDKDSDVKLRKMAEFKDNLDSKLASDMSKRNSMGAKLSYEMMSKSPKSEKLDRKSYFSDKLHKEEESTKSRFNIFKGFWRKNKYSFDKA